MNYGAAGHVSFGLLNVFANVAWQGGTFHPFVEGNVDWGLADKWNANGTFTISGTASLSPVSIGAGGGTIAPISTYSWVVLTSIGGITGMPSYNSNIWAIDTDGRNPPLE